MGGDWNAGFAEQDELARSVVELAELEKVAKQLGSAFGWLDPANIEEIRRINLILLAKSLPIIRRRWINPYPDYRAFQTQGWETGA
jgi:hypothetical protein